jgi:hypothetical protein
VLRNVALEKASHSTYCSQQLLSVTSPFSLFYFSIFSLLFPKAYKSQTRLSPRPPQHHCLGLPLLFAATSERTLPAGVVPTSRTTLVAVVHSRRPPLPEHVVRPRLRYGILGAGGTAVPPLPCCSSCAAVSSEARTETARRPPLSDERRHC